MSKEELNEEILEETTEEMNELEELTEEEAEETTGGAAGYGNVQFKCQCGKNFLTEEGWLKHAKQTGHRKGTTYMQMIKGKSSQGSKKGATNGTYIQSRGSARCPELRIVYPNRKTSLWYCMW